MGIPGEARFDPSITDELSKATIDLRSLAIGTVVDLVLAEDDDATRQARLRLRLVSPATDESKGRFDVVDAQLNPEIIRLNKMYDIPSPDRMGGIILVDSACTYRPGYIPPFTLAQSDVITPGRHLLMNIPISAPEAPERNVAYHAEVLEAQIVQFL